MSREHLIFDGVQFIKSICENYGAEEGMKLWEQIATVLDPKLKGEIFFSIFTGHVGTGIYLRGLDYTIFPSNKVGMVKAIRNVDNRRLGLKEALDIINSLEQGKDINIEVDPGKRPMAILELRKAGIIC